jgi:hypothetical protein
MKDESLHIKKDGRVFQMLEGFSQKPMPFRTAKHNYTKKNLDSLKVGHSITFRPMFGNENPVYSTLVRIK